MRKRLHAIYARQDTSVNRKKHIHVLSSAICAVERIEMGMEEIDLQIFKIFSIRCLDETTCRLNRFTERATHRTHVVPRLPCHASKRPNADRRVFSIFGRIYSRTETAAEA
jgi:hypothetical protein